MTDKIEIIKGKPNIVLVNNYPYILLPDMSAPEQAVIMFDDFSYLVIEINPEVFEEKTYFTEIQELKKRIFFRELKIELKTKVIKVE